MRAKNEMKPPAIFLMGPTASGKTAAAIALARRFPVGLVNVDSAQIYREMNIGTAKPDDATRRIYPHRLMDVLDPREPYSAARFRDDALHEMRDIASSGRVPLLVGGTGLYFRALEHGLAELPGADATVRRAIDAEAARAGWPMLHGELARVDPAAAARISPNDPQRIQRALEVFRVTGRTLTEHWQAAEREALPYRVLKLVLAPADRAGLHRRIEARFRAMMAAGFLDEVRALKARGDLSPDMPSMRAVGYRQLWEHLDGVTDLDEAVRRGIVASRRYAKRQLTWFRAEQDAYWFDANKPDVPGAMTAVTARFLAESADAEG